MSASSSSPTSQFALSNREQDELMKQTKTEALQKCGNVVKGEFVDLDNRILIQQDRRLTKGINRICCLLIWSDIVCRLGLSKSLSECARLYEAIYFRRSNGRKASRISQEEEAGGRSLTPRGKKRKVSNVLVVNNEGKTKGAHFSNVKHHRIPSLQFSSFLCWCSSHWSPSKMVCFRNKGEWSSTIGHRYGIKP